MADEVSMQSPDQMKIKESLISQDLLMDTKKDFKLKMYPVLMEKSEANIPKPNKFNEKE